MNSRIPNDINFTFLLVETVDERYCYQYTAKMKEVQTSGKGGKGGKSGKRQQAVRSKQ
jgi:hypothetical protein